MSTVRSKDGTRIAVLEEKGQVADLVAAELVAEQLLAFLRERP